MTGIVKRIKEARARPVNTSTAGVFNLLGDAAEEICYLTAALEKEKDKASSCKRELDAKHCSMLRILEENKMLQRTITHLKTAPDAYAVHNDQGYWVGIYNDRKLAEHVRDKQPPSGKEKVVPVKILKDR